MGVGHVAVGVAAARVAPRLNVGWLVFASLLADFLLGIFAALGLESAHVPADYASRHYMTFTVPYSHGLLALAVWSLLLAALTASSRQHDRRAVFMAVACVALSHYLLDGLVHVAGLPLAGAGSPKLGLGLWRNMPLELALETVMSLAGVIAFWRTAAATARSRYGIAILIAVFCALTWTQLALHDAPQLAQLIPGWIGTPLLLGAIAFVIDRKRVAG